MSYNKEYAQNWQKKNKDRIRPYNKLKQKEYRRKKGLKRPRVEDILTSAGHCSYCAMLLSSEYHQKHPLVGCLKAMGL